MNAGEYRRFYINDRSKSLLENSKKLEYEMIEKKGISVDKATADETHSYIVSASRR